MGLSRFYLMLPVCGLFLVNNSASAAQDGDSGAASVGTAEIAVTIEPTLHFVTVQDKQEFPQVRSNGLEIELYKLVKDSKRPSLKLSKLADQNPTYALNQTSATLIAVPR